jgi:hypothetical protein
MDPDPLDPPTAESPGGRTNFRGGDWSSYWYNGHIYESDTRRGLYVWKVSAPEAAGLSSSSTTSTRRRITSRSQTEVVAAVAALLALVD